MDAILAWRCRDPQPAGDLVGPARSLADPGRHASFVVVVVIVILLIVVVVDLPGGARWLGSGSGNSWESSTWTVDDGRVETQKSGHFDSR